MEPIDIGAMLRTKNPALARWTPRFMVRWMEQLICLPQINEVLGRHGHLPPLEFIRATLDYIGVSYTLHGVGHIPAEGRVVFASNHPLGGLDGLILAEALTTTAPSIKLIVNDLLMHLGPLAPIFVPVNKFGAQNTAYALQLEEMYAGAGAVITFPAGFCSRLINGRITDPSWHHNFVSKARESNRPVVPVFVDGVNSRFFYRLGRWRKALGIRLNIELLLLPREMFAQRGKHLDIYLGEPVEVTAEHTPRAWTELIRTQAYALAPQNNRG